MSPIPSFDHNNVLPPHLGSPTTPSDLSPYNCTISEVCQRFATSAERITILRGFISFRLKLLQHDVSIGFQWIDGSFVENIEKSEGRSPRDLDVVTFFGGLDFDQQSVLYNNFPEFFDPVLSKTNYLVDHYAVDCTYSPLNTVELTRYWVQLFTHNRHSVWKGILNVPINTAAEDNDALNYLNGLTA
jgi:hypothetical protein